jgi:hypothetical protein
MLDFLAHTFLGSPLNEWIQATYWLWPVMEITHFIGLALLMGGLLMVDLRMLGLFKSLSLAATHKVLPIVLFGFALNLTTGILFFVGDPMRYSVNVGFQIKMLLVLLAGANALLFHSRYWLNAQSSIAVALNRVDERLVAAMSLGLWTAVLLLGRLIPYVSTG